MTEKPKIWLEQVARDGTSPGDQDRTAAFRVVKTRNTTLFLVGDLLDLEDLRQPECGFEISESTVDTDRIF